MRCLALFSMAILVSCAPSLSDGGRMTPAVVEAPGPSSANDAVSECKAKGGHLETMEFLGPGTNSGMTEVCV